MVLCVVCCKEFYLQSSLDQHIPTCTWLHTPRKSREQLDALETKLSDSQQDKLIRELMFQMQEMQQKIGKLTQTINQFRSKQKLQIISWLNQQIVPTESVSDWFLHIPISQPHLEQVFRFDLLAGIKMCIADHIHSARFLDTSLPFCGFAQKAKTIYVFDKKWVVLDSESSKKLSSTIASRFFQTYLQWQTEQEEFLRTEEGQEKDMVFMKKIIGSDTPSRTNKLFAWLYATIQKDQAFVQVVYD